MVVSNLPKVLCGQWVNLDLQLGKRLQNSLSSVYKKGLWVLGVTELLKYMQCGF